MKTSKLITLTTLLFFGLTISSCKKEGCTDATASNYSADAEKDDGSCVYASGSSSSSSTDKIDGGKFAKYSVDGVLVDQEEDANYWGGTTVDKEVGSSGTEAVYSSHLMNHTTYDIALDVGKGVKHYGGGQLPFDEFYEFFEPGVYTFADASKEGVYIELGNPQSYYSSLDGDQTGSTFEIVSRKEVLVAGEREVKLYVKFNCKVYNGTDVKIITDGEYVGTFSR